MNKLDFQLSSSEGSALVAAAVGLTSTSESRRPTDSDTASSIIDAQDEMDLIKDKEAKL